MLLLTQGDQVAKGFLLEFVQLGHLKLRELQTCLSGPDCGKEKMSNNMDSRMSIMATTLLLTTEKVEQPID